MDQLRENWVNGTKKKKKVKRKSQALLLQLHPGGASEVKRGGSLIRMGVC